MFVAYVYSQLYGEHVILWCDSFDLFVVFA